MTIWTCDSCYIDYHYPDNPVHWRAYGADVTDGIICDKSDDLFHMYESDEHAVECETRTFGKNPCDVCGTHLAGTRHAFTVWEE